MENRKFGRLQRLPKRWAITGEMSVSIRQSESSAARRIWRIAIQLGGPGLELHFPKNDAGRRAYWGKQRKQPRIASRLCKNRTMQRCTMPKPPKRSRFWRMRCVQGIGQAIVLVGGDGRLFAKAEIPLCAVKRPRGMMGWESGEFYIK